jgi:hypothetical protein
MVRFLVHPLPIAAPRRSALNANRKTLTLQTLALTAHGRISSDGAHRLNRPRQCVAPQKVVTTLNRVSPTTGSNWFDFAD